MKVFLIRHGQASSVEVDPEKGLSKEGREEVSLLLNLLKDEKVDRVFHSGKARAKQTAEILAKGLGLDSPIEKTGLMPNDEVLATALELDLEEGNLMLVGHMPFVDRLANALLPGSDKDPFSVPTATAIILERKDDEWHLNALLSPNL